MDPCLARGNGESKMVIAGKDGVTLTVDGEKRMR